MAGLQTAAVCFGGDNEKVNTEEYNGTAWTNSNNMNNGREGMGSAGIQTAALAFGGRPVGSTGNKTEQYDGSSWTSTANMGTARYSLGSGGAAPSAAAIAFGGTPPTTAATEEFNQFGPVTKTIETT